MNGLCRVLSVCLLAVGCICAGCTSSQSAQLQQNKALVQRWFEAPGTGNWAVLSELLAPDYVWHQAGRPAPLTHQETEQFLRAFAAAFGDNRPTIEDMIAEGDKVVTRYTARGAHTGAFLGIPPTGREVTYTGISICRISEGKVAEEWEEGNVLGFMQQLGAIPSFE